MVWGGYNCTFINIRSQKFEKLVVRILEFSKVSLNKKNKGIWEGKIPQGRTGVLFLLKGEQKRQATADVSLSHQSFSLFYLPFSLFLKLFFIVVQLKWSSFSSHYSPLPYSPLPLTLNHPHPFVFVH